MTDLSCKMSKPSVSFPLIVSAARSFLSSRISITMSSIEWLTLRYSKLRLANAAMTVLRTELDKDIELDDLVFCRNDPGSYALRKPDVVGVNTTTIVDNVDRRSVDNLANVEPSKAAFAWHELLMFIEFRLVDERIGHSPSGQITSSDVLAFEIMPANTDLPFNSEKSPEQATGNQPSVLNDVSDPGSDSDIAPKKSDSRE